MPHAERIQMNHRVGHRLWDSLTGYPNFVFSHPSIFKGIYEGT